MSIIKLQWSARLPFFTLNSLSVEPRSWQTLLLHCKAPHCDRLHYGLGQRLQIFLLHHRLHILAISLRCRCIILLVLMQDYLIPRRTYPTNPNQPHPEASAGRPTVHAMQCHFHPRILHLLVLIVIQSLKGSIALRRSCRTRRRRNSGGGYVDIRFIVRSEVGSDVVTELCWLSAGAKLAASSLTIVVLCRHIWASWEGMVGIGANERQDKRDTTEEGGTLKTG